MDESSFDDLIKSKLENYEDANVDAGALDSFHEKLIASQPMSWHKQNYARLGVAASAVVATLVTIYILSFNKLKSENTVLTKKYIQNEKVIDSLSSIVKNLQTQHQLAVADVDFKSSELDYYKNENDLLKQSITTQNRKSIKLDTKEVAGDQSIVLLGDVSDISATILKVLRDEELIMIDNDRAYLFASYRLKRVLRQSNSMDRLSEIKLLPISSIADANFSKMQVQLPTTVITGKKHYMSLKQRNEIEKHYFSGIDINVGGHLDLVSSSFSSGDGSINPRIGVLADWVVSPRLSVETGVDYLATSISFQNNFQNIFLPRQTDQFGPLHTAEIDNKLLSSPINVKYRQWVGEKTQAIFKIGYTPYYSFSSSYVYGYPPTKPARPWDPEDPAYKMPRINTYETSTIHGYYGGSATASIGLSRIIKKKNRFEASIFYEKSLGTVGQQGLNMDQVGIRSDYLFKVR